MIERGYIALARGILDHPIVGACKPYSAHEAWAWILFEAVWKEKRVRVSNGRAQSYITLQRGQLSYSRSFLAQAWGWTEKCVRTFLDRLEKDGMIVRQTGQLQTVITVCNYELYQSARLSEGHQTVHQTGQQRASKGPEEEERNQVTKTSNGSSEATEEGLRRWYETFPRKRQREKARRAYRKLIASKKISIAELQARTERFAAQWAAQPEDRQQFIPYPASWLNSGEYADVDMTSLPRVGGGGIKIDASDLKDASLFTETEWRMRVTAHQEEGTWSRHWGPPPGADGCLVPKSILTESATGAAQ